MLKYHLLLLVVLFIFQTSQLMGQQRQLDQADLERMIEERFQQQEGNIDFEDFYETLLNLYLNPIDLNKANSNDLDFLYSLSPQQMTSFFDFKKEFGPFISVYELQAIPYFDQKTIQDILPFVYVKTTHSVVNTKKFAQRVLSEKNNSFVMRYQSILEQSVHADKYIGRQDRVYGQFRVRHPEDFSIGLLFEKDPGEKFRFKNSERAYGFDFYSYHLFLQNRGEFKKVIVGDYQLQFGQGLISGAGFSVGKGANTISTIKRNNTGIVPYTSTVESGYYRGMAGTYEVTSLIDATVFISSVKEDAVTDTDTLMANNEIFAVSSIKTSGFHRTENEIANKDAIRNTTSGVNLMYGNKYKTFYIGLTALYSQFSLNVMRGNKAYQRFNFTGKSNYNAGVYFNYLFENMNFFGEYARSKSGGQAYVGGVIISLSKALDFSFLQRNYDRNYHAFNGVGRAFGETGNNFNERGSYWGIAYQLMRKLALAAYYDKFSFLWLRFGVNAPSMGDEYLIRLTYQPMKKVSLYGQVKQQRRQRSIIPAEGNLSILDDEITRQYNFNINYNLMKHLKLKTLFATGNRTFGNEFKTGSMIAQDLNFELGPFKINTRFSIVDGEELGVYAYEKDVQYGFIRGQFFNGTRSYVIVRYKLRKDLEMITKYSRSKTPKDLVLRSISSDGIGSSYSGNTITELRFLVRYSF